MAQGVGIMSGASGKIPDPTSGFAAWLRGELRTRGWYQSTLATKTGISIYTIRKWVGGQRTPDPENCQRIADGLGISAETVMRAAGHIKAEVILANEPERMELAAIVQAMPIVKVRNLLAIARDMVR